MKWIVVFSALRIIKNWGLRCSGGVQIAQSVWASKGGLRSVMITAGKWL